jgi:outer membrane beta-barrel protein
MTRTELTTTSNCQPALDFSFSENMKTLSAIVLTGYLTLMLAASVAQAEESPDAQATQEEVIQPDVSRRDIVVPHIDSNDVELGVYTGVLSVEDFGSNSVRGARLAYHLTEDFFVEGAIGRSTVSDEQFRDNLLPSGIFATPEVDFKYYLVSIGYHFLPGEVFVGKSYAFGSGVYLIAGVGHVEFADISATAFSAGLGVRALPTDWLSIRVEMRDHIFDQDVLGTNKSTHNFEFTFGLSAYF